MGDFFIYAIGVGLILWIFFQTVRIVPQREQYVVENLGKYQKTLSAGFHILIPFVQKVAYKLKINYLQLWILRFEKW